MKTKKLHAFSARLMSMMALAFVLFIASCEKDDPTPEPQATCDDGIQNGDETGIDCGGSCSACEEPITMAAPDLNVGTIDMEEEGMGPDFSEENEENGVWGVFAAEGDPEKISLEIVDNPNTTGNGSAKVLKIVEPANQAVWQGFFFDLDSKITLSEPNTAISVDVHSVREGQFVSMKLEDKTNSDIKTPDIKVRTTGTGWETITFNLSADYNGLFDRMVFIMDFDAEYGAETSITNHYIDNIRLAEPVEEDNGGNTGAEAPTEGPIAPSAEASDVISLFSDTYDDVAVDTWQTEWSSVGEYTEVDLNGNLVKKYSDLDFVGIETVNSQIDASGMTHLNLDIWTPNASEIRIKLVDFGATGGYSGGEDGGDGEGDDVEHEYALSEPAQGQWVTLSLKLTENFPGLTTTSNIAQLILSADTAGEADIFIDNVYFSNDGSAGVVNTTGTYSPQYTGVFEGTTFDSDVYEFPTGAAEYAGWANENGEIYPLGFPNGGTITFTASSAGADVGVYFRFERLPYPDVEPAFNTDKATVSGSEATEYTITIPAQDASNTYSSTILYLDTRDVAVTITDIKINID